jgi:hypothetical protein
MESGTVSQMMSVTRRELKRQITVSTIISKNGGSVPASAACAWEESSYSPPHSIR